MRAEMAMFEHTEPPRPGTLKENETGPRAQTKATTRPNEAVIACLLAELAGSANDQCET
jgi:hypothetical protein